ncbi:MAG: hypothetical protein IPP49_09340 [Saprospiraceae bacterium]|nr:hypothetical protein [Saprospiraceae bacterium]
MSAMCTSVAAMMISWATIMFGNSLTEEVRIPLMDRMLLWHLQGLQLV